MDELMEVIKKHQEQSGRVFFILEEIQKKYNYIPKDILKTVAKELAIPLTQLYGVVTFYAGFSLTPKGENVISICHGTVCHVKGSKMLGETLEQELGVRDGETTPDGKFTLQSVRCLGCCSLAPVVSINNKIYGNLDREKLRVLLKEYRDGGADVEEPSIAQ